MNKIVFILLFFLTSYLLYPQWEKINNEIDSVEGTGIISLHAHKGKIYASSFDFYNDPFFYSTNNGTNWHLAEFDSVQRKSSDKNMMVIQPGLNLLRYSSDDGVSWVERDTFSGNFIASCIYNKDSTIFVGNGRDIGFFVSTDLGATWTKADSRLGIRTVKALDEKDDTLYAGGFSGFAYTPDLGKTWISPLAAKELNIMCLKVIGNKILIGTQFQGVWISSDRGETWNEVEGGLPTQHKDPVFDIELFQDIIFLSIAPDIFFHKGGIFVSYDTAKTWHDISRNLYVNFARDICFHDEYIFCNVPNDYPQNTSGVYRAKLEDLLEPLSIENYQTEVINHFFFSKPFPMPSTSLVKTRIYWDADFDIMNSSKYVINILGQKIGNDSDIQINFIDKYSSELIWDCSKARNGLYFIVIDYFSKLQTVPILVNN